MQRCEAVATDVVAVPVAANATGDAAIAGSC
jgi:hypothetical protein